MELYLDERNKRLLEFINPKKNDEILVIGTGVFPKIEYWLFNNYKCKNIISVDIDKKNLEKGKKIIPEIEFKYADAEKGFPFENNCFDKIILTEVLEHLKNEQIVLFEIFRVLKKNGNLILSVPKKRWFNIFSPVTLFQHKREYNEKEIIFLLKESGFKIEKVIVVGNIYDLFNLWLHLIYKYLFKKLHINPFFKKEINDSFKKNFKGKGTDIIIKAGKF